MPGGRVFYLANSRIVRMKSFRNTRVVEFINLIATATSLWREFRANRFLSDVENLRTVLCAPSFMANSDKRNNAGDKGFRIWGYFFSQVCNSVVCNADFRPKWQRGQHVTFELLPRCPSKGSCKGKGGSIPSRCYRADPRNAYCYHRTQYLYYVCGAIWPYGSECNSQQYCEHNKR